MIEPIKFCQRWIHIGSIRYLEMNGGIMMEPVNGGAVANRLSVGAAQGVWKAFGETQALRDVSLDVKAGECHALVGRNGAGKSTLVAILTGLVRPDRGAITLA